MKTSSRLPLLPTASLAIILAACGGAAPSGGAPTSAPTTGAGATQQSTAGPTVDACALLSDADIKALTGGTVASKEPGTQAGIFPAGCRWVIDGTDQMLPPEIILGVISPGGRDYYDKYFRPYNNEQDNKPIANLGDEAVTGMADVVMVVLGDALFQVQWLGTTKDLEVEIARKVAENLAG